MKKRFLSIVMAAVLTSAVFAGYGDVSASACIEKAAAVSDSTAGAAAESGSSGSTAAAKAATSAAGATEAATFDPAAGRTAAAATATEAAAFDPAAGRTAAAETAAELAATAATATAAEAAATAATATEAAATAPTAEETAAATGGGQPWIDSDLKENLTAEMALSPKEDFHLYVNHDWLMKTELPPGYRSYNSFAEVQAEVEKKAQAVLTDKSMTGHDAELVQSLYNAILDWDARDAAGMEPVRGTVEEIRGLDSLDALSDFLCDPEKCLGVSTFLGIGNDVDMDDSSRYKTCIWTDGPILGDAAEYSRRTEMGDRAYDAALHTATALLPRLGYTEEEAAKILDDVIALESRIQEVAMTNEDSMRPDYFEKIHNLYTLQELESLSPAYPLTRMIRDYGYGEAESFMVPEPRVIERLNEVYTGDNLESLKNYMILRYVFDLSGRLDRKAYDVYVEARNIENGSTGRLKDSKVAYDIVRSALSTPMDRAYLERYDSSEEKERIAEICRDVIDTYRHMLSEEDWLSEKTRDKALEKLDKIQINAVYPNKWLDYSSMDLTGLSYADAMKEISRFNEELDKSRTNGTVDRDLWPFDILETNAYYDPGKNSINIILGILEAPIYYDGISDEELLGGIGTVIGHEISHAFDTNGAQFDKDGNYADWWAPEDYTAFQARADKLIQYYDKMTAWEGQPVRGSNIQTEATADMAGLKVMLRIAGQKDFFDYDAFFRQYARIWRRINARPAEYYFLTQDPHPLHYLRTNATLQQFDEFLETYDIKEGDAMYLAPEDRVLVW